jgi:hypothetical protein
MKSKRKKTTRRKASPQRKDMKNRWTKARAKKLRPLTLKEKQNLILLTQQLKRRMVLFRFGKHSKSRFKQVVGTLREDVIPKYRMPESERYDLFHKGIRTFYNVTRRKWDSIDIRIINTVRVSVM